MAKENVVRYLYTVKDGKLCACDACGGWQTSWSGETETGDIIVKCGQCQRVVSRTRVWTGDDAEHGADMAKSKEPVVDTAPVEPYEDADMKRLRVLAGKLENETQLITALAAVKSKILRAHVRALIVPMLKFQVKE